MHEEGGPALTWAWAWAGTLLSELLPTFMLPKQCTCDIWGCFLGTKNQQFQLITLVVSTSR